MNPKKQSMFMFALAHFSIGDIITIDDILPYVSMRYFTIDEITAYCKWSPKLERITKPGSHQLMQYRVIA